MGDLDARRRPAVWAALAAIYVVWGSTYLGIELAIRTMPPFLMLSLRFLIAGGAALACASADGLRPTRRQWLAAILIGGRAAPGRERRRGWAEQTLDTGTAALIVASRAALAGAARPRLLRPAARPVAVAGLVVGFAGVALLAGGAGRRLHSAARAVVLVGARSPGRSARSTPRRAALPRRPLVGAAMQMLAGGVLLGLGGLVRGEAGEVDVAAISVESLAALAYLVRRRIAGGVHRVRVAAAERAAPRSSAPTPT